MPIFSIMRSSDIERNGHVVNSENLYNNFFTAVSMQCIMVTEFQPALSLKIRSSFSDVKEFSVIEHVTVGNLLPGNASGALSWVKCSLICRRINFIFRVRQFKMLLTASQKT
jgi:hypothetical protein